MLLLVWRRVGWWFVFLAGLTAINTEVEEAALVTSVGLAADAPLPCR